MIEIAIPDMTCGHCARTITQAIEACDAAARVQIDLAARKVSIASELPAGEFVEAIAEAGYTPILPGSGA